MKGRAFDERLSVIRHGVGATPLGRMFVALTAQGLCALQLVRPGEEEAALAGVLRRFPECRPVPDAAAVRAVLRQVGDELSGRPGRKQWVLDLRGTPFQEEVWRALRRVPPGTTCSYADVARQVGRPRAVRAVAQACARNPVILLVPCHRIVRRDGGLGGYSGGGVPVKRELLRREREHARRPV